MGGWGSGGPRANSGGARIGSGPQKFGLDAKRSQRLAKIKLIRLAPRAVDKLEEILNDPTSTKLELIAALKLCFQAANILVFSRDIADEVLSAGLTAEQIAREREREDVLIAEVVERGKLPPLKLVMARPSEDAPSDARDEPKSAHNGAGGAVS